jgi:hypothetical protein
VSVRRIAKIQVHVGSVGGGWSSVRSDYDHKKLRLHCTPPGLRLVEVDTSSVTDHGFTRYEFTPRRQSPSYRRTYTPSPSCEDSSETDVGQSTSTRSGHKPLALPKVCTKDYQREYDVKITI